MFKIICDFFFDTVLGKGLALAALFAGAVGAWQLDRYQQREMGATNAKSEINRQAGDIADKGRAARDAVDDATAVERLRQSFCRDC